MLNRLAHKGDESPGVAAVFPCSQPLYAAKMHASLLIGVLLLLFSRHVPAAPSKSNNRGLGEPPGHIERHDVGPWHPGKHPGDGTRSPARPPSAVEITGDGITDVDIPNTTASAPKEEETNDPPRPPEKDKRNESGDYQDCRSLDKKKFLFRGRLISHVEKFCEEAHGRAQDKNTRGVSRKYANPEGKEPKGEVIISLLLPYYSQVSIIGIY